MIRLNDINRTVIEEANITGYSKNDDSTGINLILSPTRTVFVEYNSYETRDKDIELLDKLFDVKSIEDKANEESKPSYDFGEPQVLDPEPTKPEKYVTWKEVKQYATAIKVILPNGDTRMIYYDEECEKIAINSIYGDTKDAFIYDEDLFNALMLKKVE